MGVDALLCFWGIKGKKKDQVSVTSACRERQADTKDPTHLKVDNSQVLLFETLLLELLFKS